MDDSHLRSISAVTLVTASMARAVTFYERLGFRVTKGGPEARFTTFEVGSGYLNLIARELAAQSVEGDVGAPDDRERAFWGRVIFYVRDVDALYAQALESDLSPEAPPRDAEWGERYFHLVDPDGHHLSLARPIE